MKSDLFSSPFLVPLFFIFAACSAGSEGDTPGNNSGGSVNADGSGGLDQGGPGSGGNGGPSGSGGSGQGSGGDSSGATGGATSVIDCSALPICDDFESHTVGMAPGAPWTAEYGYSSQDPVDPNRLAVTNEDAHSAPNSVKFTNGGSPPLTIAATPPGETFYLRAWLKVVPADPGPGIPAGVLIGIGLSSTYGHEIRLRLREGKVVLNTSASGDGLSPDPSGCSDCLSTPSDWFCAEMFYDGTTETARIWADSELVAEVVNNDGWHNGDSDFAAGAQRVWFGTLGTDGAAPTLFVDDVAVGTSRIGCD